MRISDCGQPLVRSVFLLLLLFSPGESCGPGRGAGRRRRPRKLTPLVFKQHVPNVSENTLGASGLSEEPIRRGDARFKDLVRNSNPDIVFQDEEGTGADRIMSQRCRDKLNTLSVSVINQWPGVRLRVTEAWDEDGMHAGNSLHYEGRAVDITTSDRDRSKNGMLARLAVEAGFDWVYYETRGQIHCSVKSDSSIAINFGGCFPPNSIVLTVSGHVKTISGLKIGDSVLSANQDGHLEFSDVISFLDINVDKVAKYYTLTTDTGHSVTLTGHHLIPTTDELSPMTPVQHITSPPAPRLTFAKDVSVGQYILVVPQIEPTSAEGLQLGKWVSTNDSSSTDNDLIVSQYFSKTKLKPHKVVTIQIRQIRGVYAPVTLKGTIVVDGVAVSCYAFIKDDKIAHAVLAPLRTFYVIRKLFIDSLEQFDDNFHSINILSYFYDTGKEKEFPTHQDGLHWYAQLLYIIAVHVFGLDITISF